MSSAYRGRAIITLVGLLFACTPPAETPRVPVQEGREVWRESSFADFADGTLADGGANTYVGADGSVRLINELDLNRDGLIDLVLPGSHDNNFDMEAWIYWGRDDLDAGGRSALPGEGGQDVAIADLNRDGHPDLVVAKGYNGTRTENRSALYWGGESGFDAERRTDLPTVSAQAVATGDLNGDGYPEVVFASNGLSYQFTREGNDFSVVRPVSDIYWGSEDGYSPRRTTQLPTRFARDVAIADLNRDRSPDLVFAVQDYKGEPGGVLVYWGSESGYSADASLWLEGLGSVALIAADLNGDGWPDLAVANETAPGFDADAGGVAVTPIPSYVYWGASEGFAAGRRTELPGWRARGIEAADLDRDRYPDLILSNQAGHASFIYWGSADGFRPDLRTALPTLAAGASTAADLNGDGYPDLVFANEKSDESYDVSSTVYWNGPGGFDPSRRLDLPTRGALSVASGDLDGDGKGDLAFAQSKDGYASDNAPNAYIYWGRPEGDYSPEDRWTLPYSGLSAANIADLDRDGWTDLVLAGQIDILWGTPEGLSRTGTTHLPTRRGFSVVVADFNRDGYLDLSLSEWTHGRDEMSLFWGGPGGYRMDNRFILKFPDVRLHKAADLDRNGYLDLLFTGTSDRVAIFWNGPGGFDNENVQYLPSKMAVGAEIGDLDGDGYLDIVICNLYDLDKLRTDEGERAIDAEPQAAPFAAGTAVYWGGEAGFSENRMLLLDTVGSEDASIADLNRDGRLDLVVSSYHAGVNRHHPSYVFWGAESGLDPKPLLLPTDSASGVMVADYNRDGHDDIFFVCHTKGGNHRTDSFLYWGSEAGYSAKRRLPVPTRGVHWAIHHDVGNVYDRTPRYDYISSPFRLPENGQVESLSWTATTPHETAVDFQVRGSETREGLGASEWSGPDGPGSRYTRPGARLDGLGGNTRWIQYKASLVSPGGVNSPVLEQVEISYQGE